MTRFRVLLIAAGLLAMCGLALTVPEAPPDSGVFTLNFDTSTPQHLVGLLPQQAAPPAYPAFAVESRHSRLDAAQSASSRLDVGQVLRMDASPSNWLDPTPRPSTVTPPAWQISATADRDNAAPWLYPRPAPGSGKPDADRPRSVCLLRPKHEWALLRLLYGVPPAEAVHT